MFQKARETAFLESSGILVQIFRWRKPLLIVVILTALVSFIFSGPAFIPPKYKSSVIFFPSANNSVSKAILDGSGPQYNDLLEFGKEEQAEQMLQILNSDEIRNAIVQKYDLMDHYGINRDEPFPETKLTEEYRNNISFSRTQFMSVQIEVYDTDAQMAANIANDIASLVDSMKIKIQRSRAEDALKIMEEAYEAKKFSMKQKEDSLQKLRNLGVMDYESQSEVLAAEYASALATYHNESATLPVLRRHRNEQDTAIISCLSRLSGAEARMKAIDGQLKTLAMYGGASIALNQELMLEREELSKLKEQYDRLTVDVNQNLSQKFLVNKASKAEKKSYPVRWLIMLVSVAGAFVISLCIILTVSRLKEIQYRL